MAFFLVSFTIVFSFAIKAINDDIVNFTSSGKPYYWVWTRFFSSLEYDVIDINEEERSVYLALFTFFIFGLLINLILLNLVTGLAIDDVQKIRTESEKQEKIGKIKMIRTSGSTRLAVTTNQNTLFRSRDWLSANQGPVFPDSVGSRLAVTIFTIAGDNMEFTPRYICIYMYMMPCSIYSYLTAI
eukprot:sb/3471431/